MALVWLAVALTGSVPHHATTRLLHVGSLSSERARQLERILRNVEGVVEARIFLDEGTAYCKVDTRQLDEESLRRVLADSETEPEAAG